MFGFGKNKAKRITKESGLTTKFSEVAGMDESKLEVMEFVDFLKNAPKYKKLGENYNVVEV
jgi:AFG3 family protein